MWMHQSTATRIGGPEYKLLQSNNKEKRIDFTYIYVIIEITMSSRK